MNFRKKSKYRLVIQERISGYSFEDKIRVDISPSLYNRIELKQRKHKKDEIITITEFGKRCAKYIRSVIFD